MTTYVADGILYQVVWSAALERAGLCHGLSSSFIGPRCATYRAMVRLA